MDLAAAAVEQCDRRIEGLEAMLRSIDGPVAGDDPAAIRAEITRMLEQERALRAQLLEIASAPIPLEPAVPDQALLLEQWRRAEKAATAAEAELRQLHRTSHGPKVREFAAKAKALRQEAKRLLAEMLACSDGASRPADLPGGDPGR